MMMMEDTMMEEDTWVAASSGDGTYIAQERREALSGRASERERERELSFRRRGCSYSARIVCSVSSRVRRFFAWRRERRGVCGVTAAFCGARVGRDLI